MFRFIRKPMYSLAEVHQYREDIEAMEKLRIDYLGEPEMKQYEDILHVMREVLLRILEKV